MSYFRDRNGVVHNTDDQYLAAIMLRRNSKKESKKLVGEITSLKQELDELKQQLQHIIGSRK